MTRSRVQKAHSYQYFMASQIIEDIRHLPAREQAKRLIEHISFSAWAVREAIEIANRLGELGDPIAVPELQKKLSPLAPQGVAEALADALARIGGEVGRAALLEVINRGGSPETEKPAIAAIKALAKMRNATLVSDLFGVIATTRSGNVRGSAAIALCDCDRRQVFEGAKRLMSTGDYWARSEVCYLLAYSRDREALPILLEALKDAGIRAPAAAALGDLGNTAALPALEAIEKEDYAWASAQHAIKQLQGLAPRPTWGGELS